MKEPGEFVPCEREILAQKPYFLSGEAIRLGNQCSCNRTEKFVHGGNHRVFVSAVIAPDDLDAAQHHIVQPALGEPVISSNNVSCLAAVAALNRSYFYFLTVIHVFPLFRRALSDLQKLLAGRSSVICSLREH